MYELFLMCSLGLEEGVHKIPCIGTTLNRVIGQQIENTFISPIDETANGHINAAETKQIRMAACQCPFSEAISVDLLLGF